MPHRAVAGARAGVERVLREAAPGDAPPEVAWSPIVGNEPYLQWVTEETKVEACES